MVESGRSGKIYSGSGVAATMLLALLIPSTVVESCWVVVRGVIEVVRGDSVEIRGVTVLRWLDELFDVFNDERTCDCPIALRLIPFVFTALWPTVTTVAEFTT